jgi:predicted metal-dependent HD superfamily phosphohydrolase
LNDISRWVASLPPTWIDGCSESLFTTAHDCYQSPGRFYHTWAHVTACVDTLRTFPCDSVRSVFLALLFHDAVYIPGSGDNEKESAQLATRMLRQESALQADEIAQIHRFILATRNHTVDKAESSGGLRATLDIDMSILGAPWKQYSSYAREVRDEYCPAVTTEPRFVAGRIAFLSKVLAAKAIFSTPEGVIRWEGSARDNIARELRELRSEQSTAWRIVTAVLRRFS